MKNDNFKFSLLLSILLHLLILFLFIYRRPHSKVIEEEQIISFEILDIADINNIGNHTQKNSKSNDILPEEAKKVMESKVPAIITPPANTKPLIPTEPIAESTQPEIKPEPSLPLEKPVEPISPVIPKPDIVPTPIPAPPLPIPAPDTESSTSETDNKKLDDQFDKNAMENELQEILSKSEPTTTSKESDKEKNNLDEVNKIIEDIKKVEEPNKPENIKKSEEPNKPAELKKTEDLKKDEIDKALEKKEIKPLIEEKKPKEIKKLPPKTESTAELESLLKNLDTPSKGTLDKSKKVAIPKGESKVTTKGPSNGSDTLSLTEIGLIKKQIERSWNLPISATNINNILITLYISFDKDGRVLDVKLVEARCPGTSAVVCKAIADSAIRAVIEASPIERLRKERYDIWRELNINFDPSDILQ